MALTRSSPCSVSDEVHVQLHVAQRNEKARLGFAAVRLRGKAAVHGHRLCAVLAQMDRTQPAIEPSGFEADR